MKETEIRVEGETSGEWVPFGTYVLPKGKKSYIEISNNNADGVVVCRCCAFCTC